MSKDKKTSQVIFINPTNLSAEVVDFVGTKLDQMFVDGLSIHNRSARCVHLFNNYFLLYYPAERSESVFTIWDIVVRGNAILFALADGVGCIEDIDAAQKTLLLKDRRFKFGFLNTTGKNVSFQVRIVSNMVDDFDPEKVLEKNVNEFYTSVAEALDDFFVDCQNRTEAELTIFANGFKYTPQFNDFCSSCYRPFDKNFVVKPDYCQNGYFFAEYSDADDKVLGMTCVTCHHHQTQAIDQLSKEMEKEKTEITRKH